MKNLRQKGWSRRRFNWLEQVQAAQEVPRGSKQLAALICNKFVDRKTGVCWPSNRKLADSLYVCRRTVQRYVSGLVETGFLKQGQNEHGTRMLLLRFPDTNGSVVDSYLGTSRLSSPCDKTVTPHRRNTKTKNQIDQKHFATPLSWRFVPNDEAEKIEGWRQWLKEHGFDPDLALRLARQSQGVRLPSYYPENGEKAEQTYRAFFDLLITAEGELG